MKLRCGTYAELGFSLVEMMMAVGILSIVAVGTSMQLINSYQQQLSMQSKANMIETEAVIQKAFSKRSLSAERAWSCPQTLIPVGAFNTATNGVTDVRIVMSTGETYQAAAPNNIIPGSAPVRINKLYLGDTLSLAPNRPTGYLTNLYLIADVGPLGNLLTTKPRAIAAVVVDLDATTGAITDCSVSNPTPTAKEVCDELAGMKWNPQTNQCDQDIGVDTQGDMLNCTGDTQKNASGICVPISSGCPNGELAKSFFGGQFWKTYCSSPPLNPAVGMPVQSPAPVVSTTTNQTPAPKPSPVQNAGAYSGPVTTGTPIPAAAPVATPSSCTGNNVMDPTNYAQCQQNTLCNAQLLNSNMTAASCTAITTVPYSTPLPASTPSYAPPADLTCQCNNTRIANGAYCAYCIPNVNLGYGQVNYAYGVAQCTNGALVQDNSQAFDPQASCSGGYAPAYRSGRAPLRQMSGGRYAIP